MGSGPGRVGRPRLHIKIREDGDDMGDNLFIEGLARVIEIPQVGLTKDQEKAIIKDFYYALPGNSYLSIILEGLVSYCEEQITNDWTINPLVRLQSVQEKAEKQIEKEKEIITGKYEIEITKRDTLLKEADKVIARLKSDLGYITTEKLSYEEGYQESALELANYREEAIAGRNTILKLKAQLYDYMSLERGSHEPL